jgi:anti-sigma B factor antagonist
MPAPLVISQRAVGDVTVLELTGRLVFDGGEREFRERLMSLVRAGGTKFLVDLEHVTYIDSAGVGALVAMLLHVLKRGGQLKLLHPSERACRVLQITHLMTVFDVFQTEAQGVSAVKAPDPGSGAS